jgi:hypothetical protein
MAKSFKRRNYKKQSCRHRQRGGYPDSAWGYALTRAGDMQQQLTNTLNVQPGQNPVAAQSNVLQLLKGGSKRRRHKKRTGGNWGSIISQAATPLILLGAQQLYGRRKPYTKKNKH